MNKMRYDIVDQYKVEATLKTPMHIGAAEGSMQEVLVHPVTRLPFIQASSITGALRDYYEKNFHNAEKLFGNQSNEEDGALIRVSDGIFSEGKTIIEFRPRVSLDRDKGTVSSSEIKGSMKSSGHKFDMEYVGVGAKFAFSIYVYHCDGYDEAMDERIRKTISALHTEDIVFGGQKSSGCGSIGIDRLWFKRYDLKDTKGREKWYREESLKTDDYEDLTSLLSSADPKCYRIQVVAKAESSILVKGYQVSGFGEGSPDSVNIQNAKKEYIVPGTSLKGSLRSRVESIAEYLQLDGSVVDEIFGRCAKGDTDGLVGNARFYDSVIGTVEENDMNELSHRIHIDKFTGGVIEKEMFSEKTAAGDINLCIDISERNQPEQAVGLLILALRDLASGMYNLGSGYHIGHGFLEVSRITMQKEQKKAIIDFDSDSVMDDDQILKQCLDAVKGGR